MAGCMTPWEEGPHSEKNSRVMGLSSPGMGVLLVERVGYSYWLITDFGWPSFVAISKKK